MLNEKYIKPIPKQIISRIRATDEKNRLNDNGTTFYSYLTRIKNDLAQVVVACKVKDHQWFCKQVVVHAVHSNICLVKDIDYSLFGYTVGWYNQGLSNAAKKYNYNQWYEADDKYYNIQCPIINQKFALTFEQYKYSVADKYKYLDLIKYLRIYEEYPQAEYLIKVELPQFATNKTLLKAIGKDKNLRKWIIKNKEILQNKYGQYAYISSKIILDAYKHDISIIAAQNLARKVKELESSYCYINTISKTIPKKELVKFVNYLEDQQTDSNSYSDYLRACEYLGLDMDLAKNRYPRNFKFWHDTRIDEYHTAKALQDEKDRKVLYEKFKQIADKYLPMQRDLKEDFMVVIAKSPAELIKEGETLHHCVGRMGYDQKFTREESLIFFVRNKDSIDKPFVTLEYSLKNHRVLQCYADHNSRPNEQVLDFVNKIWLPYANRKLKKIA